MFTCRPVLALGESWQESKLEDTKWMFAGKKEVDQESKSMLDFRDSFNGKLPLIKSLLAFQVGVRKIDKINGVLVKVETIKKDIEARKGFQTWLTKSNRIF